MLQYVSFYVMCVCVCVLVGIEKSCCIYFCDFLRLLFFCSGCKSFGRISFVVYSLLPFFFPRRILGVIDTFFSQTLRLIATFPPPPPLTYQSPQVVPPLAAGGVVGLAVVAEDPVSVSCGGVRQRERQCCHFGFFLFL